MKMITLCPDNFIDPVILKYKTRYHIKFIFNRMKPY